jgi:uncharacterized Zn finger protein
VIALDAPPKEYSVAMDSGFRRYVPVAARRREAARETARLKKHGHAVSPVVIEGRAIATTFWGRSWCENLEAYSDFANRLPRGRTYVRNGSVIDLQVAPGVVNARVSGSSIYEVSVQVSPLAKTRYAAICKDCAGAIDSLVELLQGRFSKAVMERLCRQRTGLFPSPDEIRMSCTCPDWATLCKHVAAVLYGVGARLDARPELLFALRGVDEKALYASAGDGLSLGGAAAAADAGKVLGSEGLGELFGLDLVEPAEEAPPRTRGRGRARGGRGAAQKKDTGGRPPSGGRPPVTRT